VAVCELRQMLEQAEQHRVHGAYAEAMPLYEKILEAEPGVLAARLGIAHCLLNMGEFEASLEQFARAAADHPDSAPARLAYAKMLLMLDQTEEGKAELEKVLELDPGNAEATRHLSYL